MRQTTVSRAEVYEAIDTERDYQDARMLHPAEYILYMQKCLDDAKVACYKGTTGTTGAIESLPFIRKVAALAVSCMETHGAPRRD